MEKLGINLGFLLVQIINFAILFVVLYAWVYKPITAMLEKRRLMVAKGLEDARVAEEARARAEEEANTILQEAQAKAAQIMREASERAEKAVEDIRLKAERDSQALIENARTEIEHERVRILGDLRGQVASLAIAAAQKLLGETLDETRQRRLVDEFFSGIQSGRVVVLDGANLEGETAEVTSALTLTDKEQDHISNRVHEKFGPRMKVVFKVDPSLLGGLVVRAGGQMVDGSMAFQLQNLHESLK